MEYFKEVVLSEILQLPEGKDDIERVIESMIWPEVEKMRLIESGRGRNLEGKYLAGNKLVVQLKLREKLIYMTPKRIDNTGVVGYETMKCVSIVLPERIGGKAIGEWMRNGRITVVPRLQDISTRWVNPRSIYRCGLIVVEVLVS